MNKTPPRASKTLSAAEVIAIATELEAPPPLTMQECKEWVRRRPRTADEYVAFSKADRAGFEALLQKVTRFLEWIEATGEVGRRLYPDVAAKLSTLLQVRLDESNAEAILSKPNLGELLLPFNVPGSGPMRAMVSALNNRARLSDDGAGVLRHEIVTRKAQRDGRETVTTVAFRRDQSLEMRTVDEFLRFVREAPETAVDVLIIALSWWRNHRDDGGGAWITADQILTMRGRFPKQKTGYTAGWRPEDLSEVAEGMAVLSCAWLSVENTVSYSSDGKKRRRQQDVHNSRFLAVLDTKTRTVDEQIVKVGWRYGFGEWVRLYPFDDYFARLNRALVRYHAFQEKWERRFGLYGGLHASAAANRTIERDLRSVLDEAGLLADVDTRNPHRTVKRIRTALNRLTKDGHFCAWKINGHDDTTLDHYLEKHLPARAWWPTFEQMTLTLEGAPPNGPLFDSTPEPVALKS